MKPLGNLTKRKTESTQITKVRVGKGDITANSTRIQRIISNYFQTLHAIDMENLEENDEFLGTYNLPTSNQEDSTKQEEFKPTHSN